MLYHTIEGKSLYVSVVFYLSIEYVCMHKGWPYHTCGNLWGERMRKQVGESWMYNAKKKNGREKGYR